MPSSPCFWGALKLENRVKPRDAEAKAETKTVLSKRLCRQFGRLRLPGHRSFSYRSPLLPSKLRVYFCAHPVGGLEVPGLPWSTWRVSGRRGGWSGVHPQRRWRGGSGRRGWRGRWCGRSSSAPPGAPCRSCLPKESGSEDWGAGNGPAQPDWRVFVLVAFQNDERGSFGCAGQIGSRGMLAIQVLQA